jgi:hypothetical protein
MRLNAAAASKASGDPCPAALSRFSGELNFRGGVVGSLILNDAGEPTWLIAAGEGVDLCLRDTIGEGVDRCLVDTTGEDVDPCFAGTTGEDLAFRLSGTVGGGVAIRFAGTTREDVAFRFKGAGGEDMSFSFTGHSGISAGVLAMARLASFIS